MMKTPFTILITLILVSALHFIPGLESIKGPGLATLSRIAALEPEIKPPDPPAPPGPPDLTTQAPKEIDRVAQVQLTIPPGMKVPDIQTGPPASVEDPAEIMHAFYDALSRTESFGTKTRILHYGDSPITADSITSDARAILQAQFGDGGHGFVLIGKPWEWYGHRGVGIEDSAGWLAETASQAPRAKDGLHGLGGVSFSGELGATSTIRLPDSGYSQAEVSFLRQPHGGEFRIDADSQVMAIVSTDGPEKTSAFAQVSLPAGTSRIRMTVTRGAVRLYGVELEKAGRGVIYSSLGLNGASAQQVLRYFDPSHWREQLRHENPDLVILNYGTNESVYPEYVDTLYAKELRELLTRVREAAPKASILVMSPADRGERKGGVIVTLPVIPKIVELQRLMAQETGCAFFDTFQAIGGAGTAARWYENQPRLVNADYTHPMPGGSALIASLLDRALLEGYAKWKERHDSAPRVNPELKLGAYAALWIDASDQPRALARGWATVVSMERHP